MPGSRKLGRTTDHRKAMLRAVVTCVLENGQITAQGTHEQLLTHSETYLDMWKAHISAMDWSMNQEENEPC